MNDTPEAIALRSISSESCRKDGQQDQKNEDDASLVPEQHMTSAPVVPSARLHRPTSILFLALLYTCMALFAWIAPWTWPFSSQNSHHHYGLRWYRAIRVLQSIATVLTIPVASTVCASAAVVFAQRRQTARGLTLRQVMALADRDWMDVSTYTRVLYWDGWKRYGSSFLLLAMFMNVLGLVIFPLQEIFLKNRMIKISTQPHYIYEIHNISDKFYKYRHDNTDPRDDNLVVIMTRYALMSTTTVQQQAHLWPGAGVSCELSPVNGSIPKFCDHAGTTLGVMPELPDPFWAELPNGYNTGLVSQVVPRINSSVQYKAISEPEFPTNCEQIPGAFFVDYSNVTYYYDDGDSQSWGLQACMPTNVTKSPWKNTQNRQDFSEELFLNVSILHYAWMEAENPNNYWRVTLNTTAGYFELPNYMNGGVAGPLLDKYPDNSDQDEPVAKVRRQVISTDTSHPLEVVTNRGPLLTVAMALFGEGSFIQSRIANPEAYAATVVRDTNNTNIDDHFGWPINAQTCIDMAPLSHLLAEGSYVSTHIDGDYCILNDAGGPNSTYLDTEIVSWISNFNYENTVVTNAFQSAAFLANHAWMLNDLYSGRSLSVSFDMGVDTQAPAISRAGLILISVLLGLYLVILLLLAVYATWSPRWTAQLDSFAMMRIGGVIADKVPLLVGRGIDQIKVLDEIPGWIGDQAGDNERMGVLGLGAQDKLKGGKRYMSYPGDNERMDYRDKRVQ